MTDDLVSNLREMARQYTDNQYNLYARSAGRIEKLEELVKRLRDDNSSLIDDFDKDFLRQETRIEKLETALREIADIEREDLPKPVGAAEGTLWVILAGCVEVARKALGENNE